MKRYRYELERGSKKHRCPGCGQKTFVRYVDTETRDYLPEEIGRCDRESNCGYWQKPRFDKISSGANFRRQQPVKVQPRQVFVPPEELKRTLSLERYRNNGFTKYLLERAPYPFPVEMVRRAVELYYIGTTAEGFTTFPYIDVKGRIQAVQAVRFDESNHREAATFLHSLLKADCDRRGVEPPQWLREYLNNETKVGCPFGEHLLNKYPAHPVAIVEAPKTALYASLYFGFPETPGSYLWLAAYNLQGLTAQRCQALRGRTVVLFPDLSKDGKAFNLWKQRAVDLSGRLSAVFHVSNFLEQRASAMQQEKGLDLADFLIETDWAKFQQKASAQSVGSVGGAAKFQKFLKTAAPPRGVGSVAGAVPKQQPQSETPQAPFQAAGQFFQSIKKESFLWPLEGFETLLARTDLPDQLSLSNCETITDLPGFLRSHLSTVKQNNGNPVFAPYLDRLRRVKALLSAK